VVGASDRLRPILMTACAMTVGMVPMALALEEGSQMQAPLGRAVIGGLVMVDCCDIAGDSFDLRHGHRQAHVSLAVDLPERPREPALRPPGFRRGRRGGTRERSRSGGSGTHRPGH